MNDHLPLGNLRVLELANVLAGPSVGMFLAELGAEVIKIESPKTSGDGTRQWKLPEEDSANTVSAYFASVNWGKRSVAIDLSQNIGLKLVHRLIPETDIVIASYRPGSAQKLAMDYETLARINERLIYVSISSFGPNSHRPGYDAIVQAESGFFYLNGLPDGPSVKLPVALMDVLAGHQAKEAVLLALLERMETGKGKHVEVSLIQSALAALVNQGSNWLVAGHDPQRMGSGHPNIVPYGEPLQCADGKYLVVAAGTDKQFGLLCQVLGDSDLFGDARFQNNRQRVQHRTILMERLQQLATKWESNDLFQRLTEAGVPAGRIWSVSEALGQPAAKEIGIEDGGLRGIRSFVGVSEKSELTAPPAYGRDTIQVLQSRLGMEQSDIEALRQKGIIYYPNSNT